MTLLFGRVLVWLAVTGAPRDGVSEAEAWTETEAEAGTEAEAETETETEAETGTETETEAETEAEGAVAASERVLLLVTSGLPEEGPLGPRLRRVTAELESAGFSPLVVAITHPDGEPDRERLGALAERHEANALVVFDPVQPEATLWTTTEPTTAPSRVAVVVGDEEAADGDAVLAVRLTELLHASRIEIEPPPEVAVPTPPPEHPPPPEPVEPPRWAARIGLHGAGSAQNVGVLLGPTLGATVFVGARRRFGVDVESFTTALVGRVDDPAGRASVGLTTIRALAQWWPLGDRRISVAIGGGIGPLIAWTRGRAEAPFSSQTDVTVVSLPTAAADLAVRITPWFRVRLGMRAGVALPFVRIRAPQATTEVARPLVDGGIAIELAPRSGGDR